MLFQLPIKKKEKIYHNNSTERAILRDHMYKYHTISNRLGSVKKIIKTFFSPSSFDFFQKDEMKGTVIHILSPVNSQWGFRIKR